MSYTLGKQLAQSRADQNLSVEDVAHRTRIPGSIVRYLENDDYSHFPNLVYAKSFLKMYSRYLDVDASEFLEELREASTARRDSPFLQAQVTREELAEFGKHRISLDFIPWTKILSVLFFLAMSVSAAYFIAKLYKDNKAKIDANLAGGKKEVVEPANGGGPAADENGPTSPEPLADDDTDSDTDSTNATPSIVEEEVPKALPVAETDAPDAGVEVDATEGVEPDENAPSDPANNVTEGGEDPEGDAPAATTANDGEAETAPEEGTPVASTPVNEGTN